MNKTIIYFILFILILINPNANAQCINGDFESGNFSNWQGWTGTNNGVWGTNPNFNFSTFIPGFGATQHNLMSIANGNDPYTNQPVVAEGSYSLQLGDDNVNNIPYSAQVAAYTFTVTADFSFRYSMVMSYATDITHQPTNQVPQNPFFQYWISTSNQLTNSLSTLVTPVVTKVADVNDNFFTVYRQVLYRKWNTICMANLPGLENYIGQQVTIYFLTTDCTQGGHFGYAYIDGLCKPSNPTPSFTLPNTVCSIDDLVANASGSTNAIDQYWRIEKLSSSNPTSVIPGTDLGTYLYNTPTGIMNIYQLYTSLGGTIANGYYKVTLGVRNCTGIFTETSKVVEVNLPVLLADNIISCCEGEIILKANSPVTNDQSATFEWFDQNGNFLGFGNTTFFTLAGFPWMHSELPVGNPPKSGFYKVVFTNNGCKNEKWIYLVHRANDFAATIIPDNCACKKPSSLAGAALFGELRDCDGSPFDNEEFAAIAADPSQFFYTWTNEHGDVIGNEQIIPVNGETNKYTLTVSNGCTSRSLTVDIQGYTDNEANILPDEYDSNNPQPGALWHNMYFQPNSYPAFSGASQINGVMSQYIPPFSSSAPYHLFWFTELMKPIGVAPAYKAINYKLKIYNRWGMLIYEKYAYNTLSSCLGIKNGEIFWDGYQYLGLGGIPVATPQAVEMGTYMYVLELTPCKGDKRTYKGDIEVIY